MYSPLHGTGRKIHLGGGHEATVTEEMQRVCDAVTSDLILDRAHPGEGYKGRAIKGLEALRKELRKQITLDEGDPFTRFPRVRLFTLAKHIGNWDVDKGHRRGAPNIIPVRSIMDIPLMPECAKHGLMHVCNA